MNSLEGLVKEELKQAFKQAFSKEIDVDQFQLQPTRKDFDGDMTLVVFPLLRFSGSSPEKTAESIGAALIKISMLVDKFQVVKGFLNLSVKNSYWISFFKSIQNDSNYGFKPVKSGQKFMVEYSSPNTNKPLHLGHLRNNFLGNSIARILEANGNEVIKVQIINDRGIHICKSMIAWKLFGNGETPESSNTKGDHLVGKYYVEFDKQYKAQIETLISSGKTKEEAEKEAPIMLQAQEMLRKWEANDAETLLLWEKMNAWVYEGFEKTYRTMGVEFDKLYYESTTFLIGKEKVEEHLSNDAFYSKEDGSIWVNLSDHKLDDKLLLRSDGTSVYMTQDIGTAIIRQEEFNCEQYFYVVGNEQDYHFKVLAIVLEKMGFEWASGIEHLSYGMVDLPSGKMKSREGTVVDADDLMEEMKRTAAEISNESGKIDSFSESEKDQLHFSIGMAALKYYILKVDPKKRMLFDPKESIDFNGNTGPFIQYAYARIQSILSKLNLSQTDLNVDAESLLEEDLALIKILHTLPQMIDEIRHQL